MPSAEDEDFQGSDSNDNLLSGDPLGTSPDPEPTQPLESSESIEVNATKGQWPHLSCFLKLVPRVFSSFSLCSSPSISVEEFLERQVGGTKPVWRNIFLSEW